MTLDEAILHCEEKAKEQEKHADNMRKRYGEHVAGYKMHCNCAEEYKQLEEWLRELKDIRSKRAIPVSWIENRIKRLKEHDFELAHLAAGIVQATLNEWMEEVSSG